MSLPSNGLILVHKLRENILPGDGDKHVCVQKDYVALTYGAKQYWASVGLSGVRKATSPACKSAPRLLTGELLSLAATNISFPTDSF